MATETPPSPPVTECALLPLGPSTPAILPRLATALALLRAAPGVQRTYHAPEHETPATLRLFVDWASLAAHDAFVRSDAYAPFLRELGRLLAAPASVVFAALAPWPPGRSGVLQAGAGAATEVLSVCFPVDVGEAAKGVCERNMGQFAGAMGERGVAGFTGSAQGWVLQDTVAPRTKQMSRVYVIMFGWTSVAAHMEFRESAVFKEIYGLFQEVKDQGVLETEMYHVQGLEVTEVEQ